MEGWGVELQKYLYTFTQTENHINLLIYHSVKLWKIFRKTLYWNTSSKRLPWIYFVYLQLRCSMCVCVCALARGGNRDGGGSVKIYFNFISVLVMKQFALLEP